MGFARTVSGSTPLTATGFSGRRERAASSVERLELPPRRRRRRRDRAGVRGARRRRAAVALRQQRARIGIESVEQLPSTAVEGAADRTVRGRLVALVRV